MVKDSKMREGYKQTEIGIIPVDWNLARLGGYSFITKLAGFEYTNYFNSYKDEGEVIVIRGTNITNNRLDLTDVKTIPSEVSNSLPRSQLGKGDLVFAYVGTIGPVYLVKEDFKFHLGPNTAKITPAKNLDVKYLLEYFKSWLIESEIKEYVSVGAQSSLSMTKIRGFKIIVPTLSEQKVIAKALSDMEELIESLEKLIDKKRKIKQGIMQQLLTGKKRLPGFNEKWEIKRLGDIATVYSGGTPLTSNANYYGGEIPWITSGDLNQHRINSVAGSITEIGLENSSAKMVKPGTLLLAMYGATAGVSAITNISAAINQAVLAIIPNGENSTFLYYKLNLLKDYIIKTYTQGGQPNLSGSIVKSIEFILPKISEQNVIAQLLTDMDTEIIFLEKKLDKNKAIKQGMMRELLTGRIRLI